MRIENECRWRRMMISKMNGSNRRDLLDDDQEDRPDEHDRSRKIKYEKSIMCISLFLSWTNETKERERTILSFSFCFCWVLMVVVKYKYVHSLNDVHLSPLLPLLCRSTISNNTRQREREREARTCDIHIRKENEQKREEKNIVRSLRA